MMKITSVKTIVPKSIDEYANYNARLRLSGHGSNSGHPETLGMQKLDRLSHRQMLFQLVALWSSIKGNGNVNVCQTPACASHADR